MHGNLTQHPTPHLPTGAAGAAGAVPHAAMPSGMPPGAMPPGAAMGEPGAAGAPPGLANASPEELQAAIQQFGELHPELAPYLSAGDATDLQSVIGQLQSIPPQALDNFQPAPGLAAEPTGFDLGAPLASEFGDVPDFDPGTADLSSFAGGFGANGSSEFSDLPSILFDPTAGEYGPLPTSVGDGMAGDYDALAGALSGDSGTDYTDLMGNLPAFDPAPDFATPTFEPQIETYDTPVSSYEDQVPAYDEAPIHETPMHEDFSGAVTEHQDQ
jgi:hypothetical protein